MLFRKKGTASAIIAIALLIALLASINSLLNNINAETTIIGTLSTTGQTYLVTNANSTSLTDSQIDAALIDTIRNNTDVNYATNQQTTQATLTTKNGNYTINILAVDNLQAYLKNRQAHINGSISQQSQADMGIILSQLVAVNKNDWANITVDDESASLKVTGIIQTTQQCDTQLLVPLSTLQNITQETGTVSFIEFSLTNPDVNNRAINNITQTLPNNVKVTKIQQVAGFAQDINNQTVRFINVWSLAIYTVVIAASYVMATRLINEAKFDLYTLRTLGLKKKSTINLIIIHSLAIAFVGAIIGIALGIVGTQVAATAVRWVWGNTQLAPFLQLEQALQILLLSLAASLLGSIYPAVKATQTIAKEQPT
jgi:ABC-type lipoprotein release transport system permease subunit